MTPIALDARRAAAFLGVSERRFHLLRKQPDFPSGRQLGLRQVRWVASELTEWLVKQPVAASDREPEQLACGKRRRRETPAPAPERWPPTVKRHRNVETSEEGDEVLT